jgi:hypothetical protein
LVERRLPKPKVAGSTPVVRFTAPHCLAWKPLVCGDTTPHGRSWSLEVRRAELVEADDHSGGLWAGLGVPVGDRVELEHPSLLGLEVAPLVNVTSAICVASMLWADSSTICATRIAHTPAQAAVC